MDEVRLTADSPERQLMRAMDERVEVLAFAKSHCPKEQAKMAEARETIDRIQRDHPEAFQRVQDIRSLKLKAVYE